MASSLDLQTLVQAVTDATTELSGAKFGAFFYAPTGNSGDSIMLYTLSGAPREAFEKFGQPRATTLFGFTFRGEGPIRCDDVPEDPRYGHMEPHHGMPPGHPPVRSYLAVSVIGRSGEVIGGLFFGHPEPGMFTERTERVIAGIAAQAAVAIDNARLYETAQQELEKRERAQRELQESGERFRFMAESMPQKTFTASPDGSFEYFNQQWTDFTGLPFDELRAASWARFVHPEDVEQNDSRWQGSIDTGMPFQFEHRLLGVDGVYRWHLTRAHALRNTGGEIVMWAGSLTDIDDIKAAADERKQLLDSERSARTEAERANAMKDEFLATLSHELRTPLSAILGWSQVLRRRASVHPDLRQGLETIERSARVQTQLIEDLLDMSRITSGKIRFDIQPVSPVSFIDAAIETVSPAAEAKGIRLEKLLDSGAGPIYGDPNRLQQVVWNLLSNAIKFTPKNGKVQVLLERVNSHIQISVADTGIGIEPEFLTHVFERFRQSDASTTRAYGGLGLGLAIVKHLVELHGGTVLARSPGENRGTTVTVHLPVTAIHESAAPGDRTHPRTSSASAADFRHSDLAGIKILVVDDDTDARDLIKRVLAECHAEVLTTGTTLEALAMIETERPDVLVSDIGMPEIDGYELLRKVRALGPARGGKIPAIALTAFARSEDRTKALRSGFLVHVAKPVEPSELVATVASVMGRTGEQGSER